jgi:hypothetical protein
VEPLRERSERVTGTKTSTERVAAWRAKDPGDPGRGAQRYARNARARICVECGAPTDPGSRACAPCKRKRVVARNAVHAAKRERGECYRCALPAVTVAHAARRAADLKPGSGSRPVAPSPANEADPPALHERHFTCNAGRR